MVELVAHLKRVAAESEVNKMGVNNLCLMFGPNIMRAKNSSTLADLGDSPVRREKIPSSRAIHCALALDDQSSLHTEFDYGHV